MLGKALNRAVVTCFSASSTAAMSERVSPAPIHDVFLGIGCNVHHLGPVIVQGGGQVVHFQHVFNLLYVPRKAAVNALAGVFTKAVLIAFGGFWVSPWR